MSDDNGIMQGMKEAAIFAMFKDVSIERIIELADAEREGRVVVLNEIFKTPTGQYGFIYYDKQGLMTGDFRDTKEESEATRPLPRRRHPGKGERGRVYARSDVRSTSLERKLGGLDGK